MKKVVIAVFIHLSVLASFASYANTDQSGWHRKIDDKGAITFTKSAVKGGLVKIYPAVALKRNTVDGWLLNKLSANKAPRGVWSGEVKITRQTANMTTGSRQYKLSSGITGQLWAVAFSADRQFVRFGIVLHSTSRSAEDFAKEAVAKAMKRVVELEKSDAVAQGRGVDIETLPPAFKGIKAGGIKIKPGRYIGNRVNNKNEISGQREVMLYENGEYEFLVTNQSREKDGMYVYSRASGRLDLGADFTNGVFEDCVYGSNVKTGTPVIFAKTKSHNARWMLTWTEAPDRAPPSVRKEVEKAREEEAKRYKYITAIGDGLHPEELQTVVYVSEIKIGGISGMTAHLAEDVYVLMKDGRVMDNMPVAPDMLDVSKSRSREPDRWGYWKKEGENYVFSWGVDQKRFVQPEGSQSIGEPVPKGTRLEGTWQHSSSTVLINSSIVTTRGVHLQKDGRFEKFSNSSSLVEGASSGMGVGPMVGTYSDDEGSVTAIIGANIGGGGKSVKNNPKSDRQGTYEFDGYNLTLNYDNGRVNRHFTFITGENFSTLWFEGGSLRFHKKE